PRGGYVLQQDNSCSNKMVASTSSGVVQHPESTLGHAPAHATVPDTTSSALHPHLLLFYLVATCVCLIMAYFMDSRRRASKRGQREDTNTDTPTTVPGANSSILVAPGEYIRPLGNLETFMEVGGEYGSLNTVQAIWLGSKSPINVDDIRKALIQLVHKNHILQVCVKWRGMRPWFKRMKEVVFDFAVEEDDIMAVFYTQLQRSYDMMNGPLWAARFVPIPKSESSDTYSAALVFSIHHCITDGHTNMQLCRDLMETLNASLTGRVCEVPLRPIIPPASDSLMTERDWYYVFTYFWTKLYATIITDYGSKLYFKGALKQPKTKTALTKILRENFTKEETQALLRHCKANGVAMHSCIMATANLALLQTVQQRAKYRIDNARINTVNCINMRRYFPDELKEGAGCHISLEEKEVLIPGSAANSKEHYWALVKTFQNNLNNSLNVNRIPIRNAPLFRPSTILLHVNHELIRRGLKNRTDNHMISTNMGNLKHLLPAEYDGPVYVTDILRSVSSQLTGNPFTLVFHTFDDRFMISVDYYTNKISDDAAAQFFSTLTHYIGNVARHGSPQDYLPSLEGYIAYASGTIANNNETAREHDTIPTTNDTESQTDGTLREDNGKSSPAKDPIQVCSGEDSNTSGKSSFGNGEVSSVSDSLPTATATVMNENTGTFNVPIIHDETHQISNTYPDSNSNMADVPKLNGIKFNTDVHAHAYINDSSSSLKASAINGTLTIKNGIRNCNGHLGISTVIET
ncbi:hypothetical protein SK128_005973, partial [Halocaridina rubra]